MSTILGGTWKSCVSSASAEPSCCASSAGRVPAYCMRILHGIRRWHCGHSKVAKNAPISDPVAGVSVGASYACLPLVRTRTVCTRYDEQCCSAAHFFCGRMTEHAIRRVGTEIEVDGEGNGLRGGMLGQPECLAARAGIPACCMGDCVRPGPYPVILHHLNVLSTSSSTGMLFCDVLRGV